MSLPSHPLPDFQVLFESVPGLYLVLAPDLTIVAVSDAYLRATMTKREEILGRHVFEVFPDNPDDIDATGVRNLTASLNRVLKEKIPDTIAVQKYDIRQPNGEFEVRYWSPINSPVLDKNNNVTHIIHRVEDITEFVHLQQQGMAQIHATEELRARAVQMESEIYSRAQEIQEVNRQLGDAKAKVDEYARQLEGKIHLSEEKYRILMEHAKDGVFILDEDGMIVEVNRAAEKLIDGTAQEVIGRRLDTFLGTESLPSSLLTFNDFSFRDSSQIENMYLKKNTNKKIYVDISLSRVQLADTRLILCVARDVTERVKLEQALRQAQKMEAVGQLTGGLAHDFNNILGVIIGNLDLMQAETTTKGEKLRAIATEAAVQASELIRALLAFSRRQPLNPSVIDINQHLNRMTDFLRRVLGEQIEIKLQTEETLWPVRADLVQLEAAITNLTINARDAMNKGGQLLISTRNTILDDYYSSQNPDVTPGDYTLIEVSDTGCGIPPEVMAHVFEPFFTTKDKGKGSGLGLSMVYGFIKQSGGHIKIYSEPGHGTTIKLYFPCHKNNTEAGRAIESPAAAIGGHETILVVEDNIDMRSIAVKQLQSLGYKTIEAANGMQALAAINSGIHFDLLFSDVIMPGGLTGFDLVRQVGARLPSLPILLTSGFPGPIMADKEGSIRGMNVQLLSKPYRKEDLAGQIRKAIDEGREKIGRVVGAA